MKESALTSSNRLGGAVISDRIVASLLDEVCFNRLCRPVMRSLSYYTNFFDFSIFRKLL